MAKPTRKAETADRLYRGSTEPTAGTFHSSKEGERPDGERVHHNNDQCEEGRKILPEHWTPGTGGYRLCKVCGAMAATAAP